MTCRATRFAALIAAASLLVAACGQADDTSGSDALPDVSDPITETTADSSAPVATTAPPNTTTNDPTVAVTTISPAETTRPTTPEGIEIEPLPAPPPDPSAGPVPPCEAVPDIAVVCVNGPLLDPNRTVFEPGDTLDVILSPDADGEYPAGLRVGCAAGASYPLENVLDPITLVDAGRNDLLDGIERTVDVIGIELDDPSAPLDRWVLLEEGDDSALVYNPEGTFLQQLELEATAAGWSLAGSYSGGGDCELLVQLPDGLGDVRWTVDPATQPGPASTTIAVLAEELSCTGGRAPGERLLGPQVVETDTEVLISFAAIPLTGGQLCPGNPSTSFTIELDQAIGERTLREGRSTGLTLNELVTS